MAPRFYDRGVPGRWVEMVRHTREVLGPKVLASRIVRDYTERYYAPAAASLRRTLGPADGAADDADFGGSRSLAEYRQRVARLWPTIKVTDVNSSGLPDTPLLGSLLTLSATVQFAGVAPDEIAVQAVLGRVAAGDVLVEPVTVPMPHTGSGDGGTEIFSTTTPLPFAGSVGYTVRVLPHEALLAGDNELGLVTVA